MEPGSIPDSRAFYRAENSLLKPLLAIAMNNFHQLDCLLLHLHYQAIHFGTKMIVENHAGHRHHNTHGRVVQRYRDATGELSHVMAGRGEGTEQFNHADDRTQPVSYTHLTLP